MVWIIRIVLFPVRIVLSILIAFLKFLLSIGTFLLGAVSLILIFAALACFIQKEVAYGIEAIILAFIFSPYGLPIIAAALIGALEAVNNLIGEI